MPDDHLTWLPGWRIRDLCIGGSISPLDVTRHFIERCERLEPKLHAFITLTAELALEQARAAQQALREGHEPGPLFGVPVSIKDLFWTQGVRTTGGSLIYRDFVPAEDSVYAQRLREAGAILLGKTNTPEFGLFGRTSNRIHPESVNPWDTRRTTGGSSGGAAASVASGMCPLAVGSDGAGSIRVPSAFCGVFGLQSSSGRVPNHGGMDGGPFPHSTVGPITRDVRDAALMLQVLAGPDPRDPYCRQDTPPDYLSGLDAGVRGFKLGWIDDFHSVDKHDSEIIRTAERATGIFTELGADVEPCAVRLATEEVEEAFWTFSGADRYALLGQPLYEDPATRGLLAPYTRERFASARQITTPEYVRALRARARFIHLLEYTFTRYDLLLSPTAALVAPRIDADASRAFAGDHHLDYTWPVNFAGFTAASVPCGCVDGVPVGLQVIGRPNREDLVLRACRALEQARPWAMVQPKGSD